MRIVFQGGDNMFGRAVQLTLPYQTEGDDQITDSQSAQLYLDQILPGVDIGDLRDQNVRGEYLWGDVPFDLGEDVRILNLEAAPTLTINNPDIPAKTIHYHVNMYNIPLIFSKFAAPIVLSMANNHTIDMGKTALTQETLKFIPNSVGVGNNIIRATEPKRIGNLAIYAFGAGCSGVPSDWAATSTSSGIAYLPPIDSDANVDAAFSIIQQSIRAEDYNRCICISIHWGPNWASTSGDNQPYRVKLAHRLIDEAGVSIIYGHSSHHIRGIELYRGKLILYGAGDFINDYENISSKYDTGGALFIVDLNDDYTFKDLNLIPFEVKKLQCKRIVDVRRIRALLRFINDQSKRDCMNPLLLSIY